MPTTHERLMDALSDVQDDDGHGFVEAAIQQAHPKQDAFEREFPKTLAALANAAHKAIVTDPMSERELGYGVRPLEDIHAEWETLTAKLAPMWALYGPGGTTDHLRKNELARIDGLVRANAVAENKTMTEPKVDAACRNHPQYIEFVAKMTTERAEFYKLQNQLTALDWQVNRGQALLKLSSREPQ